MTNEEQLKAKFDDWEKFVYNFALEEAARAIEKFHEDNLGVVHSIAAADAKRIRKLKF